MDAIRIIGGSPLKGKIQISGAKNATLPLLSASLLTDQALTFTNIPHLADVLALITLLKELGVEADIEDGENTYGDIVTLNAKGVHKTIAPYDMVRKMRASILILGPLVARFGQATVSLPGGCAIGPRPIDLHLKGLEQLGATIELQEGYVKVTAPQGLKGATIMFPLISVTATENLLMAACLAEGETKLINAACEPEVADLAHCLNQMGAKIKGIGTDTLVIEGVPSLKGTTYQVMPDRIETGTYAIAAAMTGGDVELIGGRLDLLPTFTALLNEAGVLMEATKEGIRVKRKEESLKGLDVITEPFPGFATDLQAQIMALFCLSQGASQITETIFENRFMHIPELCRMGADIKVHGNTALVRGVEALKGAPVMATDLRASVSLVIAGLAAKGETIVNRIYHLDRGYESIENKLNACGANIERIHG